MWVIELVAFFILTTLFALYFSEEILNVVPITTALWLFLLFLLALFRSLNYFNVFCFLMIVFGIVKIGKGKHINISILSSIGILIAVLVIIISLCKDRMVNSYDEISVWAIETKYLFLNDGFSQRGKNVAVSYGDYCPGIMLFAWWFCQIDSKHFQEGLFYAAYWGLYFLCVVPIMASVSNKCKKILFPCLLLSLIIPGVFSSQCYNYVSAELPICSAFACSLWCQVEWENHTKKYNKALLSSCFLIMTFLKSTGLVFSFASVVFGVLFEIQKKGNKKNIKDFVLAMLPAIVLFLFWRIYCYVMLRSSYFAGNFRLFLSSLLHGRLWALFKGNKGILYFASMLKSYFLVPLHIEKNGVINFSPALFFLFLFLVLWLCFRKELILQSERRLFVSYYFAMQLLLVLAILFMCVFIFCEEQYLNSKTMMYTISRYGEPFFLGYFLFILGFLSQRIRQKRFQLFHIVIAFLLAFVILSGDLTDLANNTWRCKKSNEESLSVRDDILQRNAMVASALLPFSEDGNNESVLILYGDGFFPSELEQRWLQYLLVPYAIYFNKASEEDCNTIILSINTSRIIDSVLFQDFSVDGLNNLCPSENIENNSLVPLSIIIENSSVPAS